jgi:hypothetical protein
MALLWQGVKVFDSYIYLLDDDNQGLIGIVCLIINI